MNLRFWVEMNQKPIAGGFERSQTLGVLAKVCSAAVNGIDAYPLEVETPALAPFAGRMRTPDG